MNILFAIPLFLFLIICFKKLTLLEKLALGFFVVTNCLFDTAVDFLNLHCSKSIVLSYIFLALACGGYSVKTIYRVTHKQNDSKQRY